MYDKCNATSYIKCCYTECIPKGPINGPAKLWCPTLMPNIPMAKAKVTPTSLNAKSVFGNDPACGISVPNQIPSQNFITAMKSVTEFENPNYPFGGELEVEALDPDMQKVRMTTHIDNSVS